MPAAAACLAVLAIAPALAAGKDLYASPTGANIQCTQKSPCSLGEAANLALDGDNIVLEAGLYLMPYTGITISDDVSIGGTLGEVPVLQSTDVSDFQVQPDTKALVHDLRIEGEGGLRLESGTAERVYVSYEAPEKNACELSADTVMRDSVCWAHEGIEGESEADAVHISLGGEGLAKTVTLRNVTAVTTTTLGSGLYAQAAAGAKLTVDARNVIARAANAPDVIADLFPGGFPEVHVNLANSNYATIVDNPSFAVATKPGTNGNQTAPPVFISALSGDFHQAAASPTIDGGVADAMTGQFDLDGLPRVRPGCLAADAPVVPDIGAYEAAATLACPPKPPPPPPQIAPRQPVFRILKLALNKRSGNGKLIVEVPSAGTVSLTGSGIKLVRRPAGEAGIVTLPVQPWVITTVRLNKLGKTRIRLKVIFESPGSPPKQAGRTALLKRGPQ